MVRKLTLWCLGIGLLGSIGFATDEFPREESAPTSSSLSGENAGDDNWISELRAITSLLNDDALACIARCDILIQRADRIGIPGVAATARMQRSNAQTILGGIECGLDDFKSALKSFPAGVDPAVQVLFTQALCRYERHTQTAPLRSVADSLKLELARAGEAINRDVRRDACLDLLEYKALLGELDNDDIAEFQRLQIAADKKGLATQIRLLQTRSARLNRNQLPVESDLVGLVAVERIIEDPEFVETPRALRIDLLLSAAELNHVNGNAKQAAEHVARARQEAEKLQNKTLAACCAAVSAEIESSGGTWTSCVDRLNDAQPLLSVTNNPEVLHRFAALTARLPGDSLDSEFRSEFSRRIAKRLQELQAYGSVSLAMIAKCRSDHAHSIITEQTQVIESKKLEMDKEEAKSLRFAQVGFLAVGILVLVLLRERVKLRKVNRRLKDEILLSNSQRIEREQIELRLAQAEKMESLGALAGGVAHDFNNLLVGVMGNADLLRHVDPSSPLAKQCLDGIVQSAETAARLSRKMLAYAGKEPSTKATVDLNDVIHRIMPLLQAGLGQKHAVRFFATMEPLVTEVDTGQIDQVVLNLTANASQALASRAGEIVIRTGRQSLAGVPIEPATFGNRRNGGEFVWLEVSDNGPGIEASNLCRIFEPFFTTKADATGHGFGLSVVYGLVNRHDGLIQLTSVPGEGTSFRILLPVAETQSAVNSATPEPSLISGDLPDDLVLVVVDDQTNVLDVVKSIFVNNCRTIRTFPSATEALEFLADSPRVDCMLLDSMMPVMDGNAMLDEMALKGISVPVVMMSGYSTINLSDFQNRQDVKATIQKPFLPADLLAAVAKAIQIETGADSEARVAHLPVTE